MKKKLVYGFSALLLALTTLAGCNTQPNIDNGGTQDDSGQSGGGQDAGDQEAPVVDIETVLTPKSNTDPTPKLLGKRVRIAECVVSAIFEDRFIVKEKSAVEESNQLIFHLPLEVHCQEISDMDEISFGDTVTLEGEVSYDSDSRVISLINARSRNEAPAKDEFIDNLIATWDGASIQNRFLYDLVTKEVLTGNLVNGYNTFLRFQLAEDAPELTGEDQTLKVTFENEFNDLTVKNNRNVFTLNIPGNLTDDEITNYAVSLGELKKGDCFHTILNIGYDFKKGNHFNVIPNVTFSDESLMYLIFGYKPRYEAYESFESFKSNFLDTFYKPEVAAQFPNFDIKNKDTGEEYVHNFVPNMNDANSNTLHLTLNAKWTDTKNFGSYKISTELIYNGIDELFKGNDNYTIVKVNPSETDLFRDKKIIAPNDKNGFKFEIERYFTYVDMTISHSDKTAMITPFKNDIKTVEPFATFDLAKAQLNKDVDNIGKIFHVDREAAFETKLPNLTQVVKTAGYDVQGYTVGNNTATKDYLEADYSSNASSRHSFGYVLDTKHELVESKFPGTYEVPKEIKDAFNKFKEEATKELRKSTFLKSMYAFPSDLDTQKGGLKGLYNEESREFISFELITPTKAAKKPDAPADAPVTFEGKYQFVINIKVVDSHIAQSAAIIREWRAEFYNKLVKDILGVDSIIPAPEFEIYNQNGFADKLIDKAVFIILLSLDENVKDSYIATLKAAGYEIEAIQSNGTTFYNAKSETSDIVLTMAFIVRELSDGDTLTRVEMLVRTKADFEADQQEGGQPEAGQPEGGETEGGQTEGESTNQPQA